MIHPKLQWARRLCADEAPYAEIDAVLSEAVDLAKDAEQELCAKDHAGKTSPTAPAPRNVGFPVMTDDEAARQRSADLQFIQRAYRTGRVGPLVGVNEVLLLLDIDRTTLYRWMKPGSGLLGAERTHMIPPARVGAGAPYAAALRARADMLRADGAPREKIIALEAAALRAEESKGRAMWVLEDVLRFAPERIRAPAGRAKPRGRAKG